MGAKGRANHPGPDRPIQDRPVPDLSRDDRALFESAMGEARKLDAETRSRRAVDGLTAPDPADAKPAPAPEPAPAEKAESASVPAAVAEKPSPSVPTFEVSRARRRATPFTGIDKRTAQRLKRGQMKIEARLDLHGMTRDQAHAALRRFIADGIERGRRCVLVIPGKGSPRESDDPSFMPDRDAGILRSLVPKWLATPDLARHIVSWQPATPKHGGEGALYVLLKRTRA